MFGKGQLKENGQVFSQSEPDSTIHSALNGSYLMIVHSTKKKVELATIQYEKGGAVLGVV